MRFILLFAYITAFAWLFSAEAQQNINSLTTKDIKVNGNLEVNSTTLASKPCPVMTEAQRNAISSPQSGRCIYNSNTSQLNIYNGTIWKSAGGGISNWEAAFNYALNDVVIESNKIYQCNTAHTSTVFASDIANWTQIANNVSDASGVLPMSNGGTDKNLTPTLGGVVYTDANSMEVLSAGTSGQVLKSNGAAAPTWQDSSNKVQGQAQTEVDFTKLEFPDQNVTQTATDVQLVYDSGLIFDGGFESATAFQGHTLVSGSTYFTIVTDAQDVLDGKKTARVTCFNAAPSGVCKIEQTVNLGTFRLNGFPMLLSVRVESSPDQPLTFCAKIDGVEKDCVTGYKGYLTIPTQAGSTSVGYTLSKNEYVSPLTSLFDSIKVEITETVTNAPVVGPRVQYTPTFTGFGVVTNVNCYGQQIGPNELIDCTFTSGTPTAVEARVSLRSGLASNSGLPTTSHAGYGFNSAASTSQYVVIKESSVSYVTFGRQAADTGGLTKQTGSGFIGSGQTFSFYALVPIAQYQASVPTYSDRCRDQRNCETVFSAKIGSAGAVSEENLDFINGNASISDTSLFTLNFNTSLFSTAPNCVVTSVSSSSTVSTIAKIDTQATTTAIVVRTYDTSTSSSFTKTAYAFDITCQRQGQDYINAKVNQIVGSFKDYVRTPNTATGKVGFCSAKISATGAISDQLGGCFASCTNATTPVCTFTSNYWRSGSVPNCWLQAVATSFNSNATTLSSTQFSAQILNDTGSPLSGARTYFCHGEIQ